jgi:hypothetical protein
MAYPARVPKRGAPAASAAVETTGVTAMDRFSSPPTIRRPAPGAPQEEDAPPEAGLDAETLYETVIDALRTVLAEEGQIGDVPLLRRFVGGKVVFWDAEGREVKDVPVEVIFRKVTTVREKLRIIEQKINNAEGLDAGERAEIQAQLSRASGALTTFNFLFREERHKFRGTGG